MHPKLAPTEEKRGGTMNTWVGSTIVVLCVCSESQLSVERSFQPLGFLVELTTLPKRPKWPTGSSLSTKPSPHKLPGGWAQTLSSTMLTQTRTTAAKITLRET